MAGMLQYTDDFQFQNVQTGLVATRTVLLYNTSGQAVVLSSATITSPFTHSLTFPTTLAAGTLDNPTVLAVTVSFTPSALGAHNGNLVIHSDDPTQPLTILIESTTIAIATGLTTITPNNWDYANTEVNVDSAIKVFTVTNVGTADVIVSALALPATGWFIAAAPIPSYPVTLHTNDTLTFGVKFKPTVDGLLWGRGVLTTNASPANIYFQLAGKGYLILPVYPATGSNQLLFGFEETVLELDPTDFECEETASCESVIMLPFQTPEGSAPGFAYEKQVFGIWFHYEDHGVAVIRISCITMRGDTIYQNVTIGSIVADEKIELGEANLNCTDEVVTIKFEKISGPIVLVDWFARYVMKGERGK